MAEGETAGSSASASSVGTWRARAFGVDFELDFESPSLRRCTPPVAGAGDPTELRVVDDSAVRERWTGSDPKWLGGMLDADGSLLLDIREDDEHGILFEANVHGRYLIEPGYRRVLCAPPDVPAWHWQRMLVGQILPLVAALRGLHVVHASGVVIDGRAVALSGQPGAGKSTLALELALRQHDLLAEDVVALRLEEGRPIVEPGVSLVNLRPSVDAERVIAAEGFHVLGRSHKLHLDLPRGHSVLPLEALYLLEPAPAGQGRLERLREPSLPELAQTSFVPYLSRKEDLLRQLELSASIARTVSVVVVHVDRTEPPAALAGRIEEHVRELAVV